MKHNEIFLTVIHTIIDKLFGISQKAKIQALDEDPTVTSCHKKKNLIIPSSLDFLYIIAIIIDTKHRERSCGLHGSLVARLKTLNKRLLE